MQLVSSRAGLALQLAGPDAALYLMADPLDRLWYDPSLGLHCLQAKWWRSGGCDLED